MNADYYIDQTYYSFVWGQLLNSQTGRLLRIIFSYSRPYSAVI